MVMEWSRVLAGRVLNDAGLSPEQQIGRTYRLLFSRDAKPEEIRLVLDFLDQQSALLANRLAKKEKVPLPDSLPASMPPERAAAFVDVCHTLLNSNEFIYMN
jgi:hypothetical protein